MSLPTPRNLNYWWTFGGILALCLMTQIVTGIVLAMHYTPNVDLAFASVERIMRDVNGGWLIRYVHANGASMFFIAVYLHMLRGLYYGSYKAPREMIWIIGCVIFFLMIATAFLGYVLPWGQMSFWGAEVITNLIGAIPVLGEPILIWLRGGPAIDNATLNRFFSLHYLLPFAILGCVVLHLWALHSAGQNNPVGILIPKDREKKDLVPFHPYFTVKDGFAIILFLILFAIFVFYQPNALGHADNYIPANPLQTPVAHRARVVHAALLRHPARHPGQVRRRGGDVQRHRRAVRPALAGYVQGAVDALSPDHADLLLHLPGGGRGPGLVRWSAAGRAGHPGL
jgi:ubiquinol-cytochrome c reductase cytochrome b subunit